MERFFDDLSKRLAKAVSRREMLKITSRTLASSFFSTLGINRVWAQSSASNVPGLPGSSVCGAVQLAIQLAFPDPSSYTNHGQYVSAIARSASVAQSAMVITSECSGCIVSQFAEGNPISQQQVCGTVVAPTQTCTENSFTTSQIQVATVLALGSTPNAWTNGQQFQQFVTLIQGILGCAIEGSGTANSVTTELKALAAASDQNSTCLTPGVNYCGPGNSLTNPLDPPVAPCLNALCYQHDSTYYQNCVPDICDFTSLTAEFDQPLIKACLGLNGGCPPSALLSPSTLPGTLLVCSLVLCLSDSFPLLVSAIPDELGVICTTQNLGRSLVPQCNTSPTQCLVCGEGGEPSGEGCVGICCPCGTSCANGGCECAPGQTFCGDDPNSACCPAGQICSGGVCTACSAGQTACGTTCCVSGETCCGGTTCCPSGSTCQNGSCTTSTCPPGTTACSATCCGSGQTCMNGSCIPTTTCAPNSCLPGQPCCVNFLGQPGCGPSGYFCCPATGNACPPGTTCCGALTSATSATELCCSSGETCFAVPGIGAACCPAGDFGCTFPGGGIVGCCPNGYTCNATDGFSCIPP